ncbi:MAG: c-type cytochrome [Helicobacteraceae bacterium]|jgi:cytochrome c553|nr:c-type cytochrome [Helicobacteraceae bacterium]
MKYVLIALALASALFADAQTLFKQCQICHGKYAEKPMGSRNAPGTLTQDQISYALTRYRDNFQTSSGNAKIMSTNVRRFTDQDIADMAAYIKELQTQRQAEIEAQAEEKLKNLE